MDQSKEKEKTNGLLKAKNSGAGRAILRKKEKRNGLVGDKNRGQGRANLRKKEKTNGYLGLKPGGGEGQPKEKRENEWLLGVKTRRRGGPT